MQNYPYVRRRYSGVSITKLLNIMKLTAFFLLIAVMQIHANGYSQRITLKLKDATMHEAFNAISKQTGYRFLFNNETVDRAGKVTITIRDSELHQTLDLLFQHQPLSYSISGTTIIIKPLETQSEAVADVPPPPIGVKGTIVDENNNPLPNVSVTVKGSNKGTTTDEKGVFQIEVPDTRAKLIISHTGFESREIGVGNNEKLARIVLVLQNNALNDIVVTGYSSQRRANISGAVESVSGKAFNARPQGSATQLLQGISPGLNIATNNTGGEPDATMNFNIRGMGTPFVLVDGMPMNINQLNPADVESISVLKDASSAAIYGAYAPYGVILVTTKKGGSADGKPSLSYNSDFAWSTPTRLPRMANGLEFANSWNDAAQNAGIAPIFSDDIIAKIEQFMKNPNSTDGTAPDPLDPTKWGKHEYANASTDWYKELIKKWSLRQKHNLTVNGGRDGFTYYLSTAFYDQKGQMKYGNESYERYNIDAKINSKINKWLQVNFLTKYARGLSDYPNDGYGLVRSVMWHDLTRRWATDPLMYPNGEYSEMARVNVYENGGRDIYTNNELWLRFEGVLEPVKKWFIKGDYSWKNANMTNEAHHALVYATGPTGDKYVAFDTRTPNDIAKTTDADNYWTYNISSSYEKKISGHTFKGLAGFQREYQFFSSLYGLKNSLITDNVPSMTTATGDMTVRDNVYHWSTEGFFFRLNYDYKEKYLLELNARRNGTSRFEESKRYGFFPSVSAGYKISSESFWEPIKPVLNYFKLRASYGSLGNQNVANYLYLPIMPITSQVYWVSGEVRPIGVGAPGLVSSGLTWETVRTFNIGLDGATLGNRLDFNFDFFRRRVINMLGTSYPLPAVLGTSVPLENNAEKLNTGWEFSAGWNDKAGDLSYNFKVTLSDYIIEVTKWNNPNKTLSTTYVGQHEGDIWGFESKGLFQSQDEISKHADQSLIYANWNPGDVKYEDLNGDGVINYGNRTLDDHGDLKIIGNSLPRYSYAFFGGASWKNFDFNMFWMGVGKRDVWFSSGSNVFWGQLGNIWQNSTFKEHLDYWSADSPNGYYPRPYFSAEGNKNREASSLYLQSAAFLRLKSLQVGYSLPEHLLERIAVKKARIYFNAENLLTFSPIKGMFDPEGIFGTYGQGKVYPLSKIVSVGINVNF